jgi:hypothetical protein
MSERSFGFSAKQPKWQENSPKWEKIEHGRHGKIKKFRVFCVRVKYLVLGEFREKVFCCLSDVA